MSEERKGPQGMEQYSFIGQLTQRLDEEVTRRLERMSPSAFKAMMAYFESKQLSIGFEISATDDPVRNAKLRGQNELLVDMASEMFSMLREKQNPPKAKKEDSDE